MVRSVCMFQSNAVGVYNTRAPRTTEKEYISTASISELLKRSLCCVSRV